MKSTLFNFYFKLTLIVLCLPSLLAYPSKCKSCRNQYGPLQLEELKSLSVPSRLKPKGALLAPLLIPRVSGSTNNTKVRNFIVDQLTQLNWHVELDTFEDSTPHGQIEFTNVIATKNPYADTKIIFAAHFDSKYFAKPENTFIGATDSAVPCAILLDMAITLNSYLEKSQISNNSTTIQLVFFDGEEAFQEWTNDDSIYGARHLAAKWVEDPSLDYYKKIPTLKNKMESIELFILLDLLGTAGTPIYSLNPPTHHYFEMLYDIENSIFKNQLQPNSLRQHQFLNQQMNSYVDDDHRPFLEKDVPVLHLIPVPFPKVWHRMSDNAKALSNPVIQHLALVFRVFAARLLCLEV